jgi:BASS family bile acid:Na+ symporter
VDAATFINLLTLVGLIAIMLAMGLKVTFAEVLASARQPWLVVAGLAANFVLVPTVTVGLLSWVGPEPMVSLGFLILAVCPGAPAAPPFASIARGDIAYAVGQMVILAGLSALLAPALLGMLMGQLLPESDLSIDFLAIVRTLLIAQILPLAIGLGIHHWLPRLTARIAGPVGLLANVLLLGVLVILLVRERETLAIIRLRGWVGMFLLLAASGGIGWLCGGPGRARRKALALTTAVRNAAVALVIVSSNFPDTPAVTAVVAYALVSIFSALGCAYLFSAVPDQGERASPPALEAVESGQRGGQP